MDTEIVTRAKAKAAGMLRYFTGSPCKNGHVAERQTSNGTCMRCQDEKSKAYRCNPDTRQNVADTKRRYREKNIDRVKAYAKQYRADKAKEHSERFRKWHAKASQDPDYLARKAEATRKWVSENPGKSRAATAKRRGLKRGQKLSELDRFVFEEATALAQLRELITGFPWHVDHMIPLSRGGAHAHHNVQVIPAYLNLRKRNRMIFTKPFEWMSAHGR